MWKVKTPYIFLFLLLISLASVNAVNYNNTLTEDTYTSSSQATSNFGSETYADTSYRPSTWTRNSFFKPEDLSGYNKIVEAYIWVNAELISEWTTKDLYVDRVTSTWNESTLTWNTNPSATTTGRITRANVASTDLGWWQINITDWAEGWRNGTYNQYGIRIKPEIVGSSGNNEIYRVSTKESSNISLLPYIWFRTEDTLNYTISVVDEWDGSPVNNISVTVDGYGTWTNTTGNTIYTNISTNKSLVFNISSFGENYFNRSFNNQNLSNDNELELYPFQPNITYNGFISNGTYNYTRDLVISIYHPVCSNSIFYHDIYIDGVVNSSNYYNCSVDGSTVNYTFSPDFESLFNISIGGNVTSIYGAGNYQSQNNSFFGEVNPPNITLLSYTVGEGFGNPTNNFSMICEDSVFGTLTYNMTLNTNDNLFYGNLSNGTLQSNTTSLQYAYGTNTLNGACSDLFSTVTSSVTKTIYYSNITLIDEQENDVFDINNITGARVYYDDNRSFYDFKTETSSSTLFTSNSTSKLRFELTYADGTIITRYADVTLVPNGNLRICAFKDNGIQAYQQLVASTTEQQVAIKNVFSNCYIAIDTTRFAYENDKILNAYSITSLYYLYTYTGGNQVYLASIDGGQESSINLDVLAFTGNEYDVTLLGQSLGVERTGATTLKIVYYNPYNNSDSTTFSIKNMDNGATILSMTLTDPNSMTLYFDYSTLDNSTFNATTLFKGTITANIDGEIETMFRYFNLQGKSGTMNSSLAFVIMLFMSIAGLTFTRASLALSWFGIIVVIISLAIGALAVTTPGILLLQGLNVITLLFILVTMFTGNSEVNVVK